MRQVEYLYLHGLLVEVRRRLREDGEIPAGAFDAYDAHGVGPTALHRQKDDHHEALELLLDGVDTTLATRRGTDVEAPVPAGAAGPGSNRTR